MARGNLTRVALCCKEELFADAIGSLLDRQGSFQVVATERSPRDLIGAAKNHRAQVLLVDSFQLDRNELQFLMGAHAFGNFAIVLIVAENERETYVETPVDRLISREASAQDLFAALEQLSGNASFVVRPDQRESRRSYRNGNNLTRREYEVAQLVSKGMSNRKVSQIVGLREQSVKNLVSVIMRKLGCENRVQVALRLTAAGVVDINED